MKQGPALFVKVTNGMGFSQICRRHVRRLHQIRHPGANLQEAADAAHRWTTQNDMKINESKTKASYGKLFLSHSERVTQTKVLNITITIKLMYCNHAKRRQEAVVTAPTQTVRHSRERRL